jgi:tRNA(fMet)-specific endonuclease VapC
LTAQQLMLDTNVVSDFLRDPSGAARSRMASLSDERPYISAIVAAELRFGILKKGSERLSRQLQAVLGAAHIVPWGPPADREYARIRLALQSAGKLIGPNDMLIAAHALAFGVPLVTANLDEFLQVPGLAVVPWR